MQENVFLSFKHYNSRKIVCVNLVTWSNVKIYLMPKLIRKELSLLTKCAGQYRSVKNSAYSQRNTLCKKQVSIRLYFSKGSKALCSQGLKELRNIKRNRENQTLLKRKQGFFDELDIHHSHILSKWCRKSSGDEKGNYTIVTGVCFPNPPRKAAIPPREMLPWQSSY